MTTTIEFPAKPFALFEMSVPAQLKESYTTECDHQLLRNLTRLNVFIGPNNSGKSRLLRAIFADQKPVVGVRDEESCTFRGGIQYLRGIAKRSMNIEAETTHDLLNIAPFLRNGRKWTNEASSTPMNRVAASLRPLCDQEEIEELQRVVSEMKLYVSRMNAQKDNGDSPVAIPKLTRVYVPTLRGLRKPTEDSHFYGDRTKKDYFAAANHIQTWAEACKKNADPQCQVNEVNIHTGLEMYDIVRSHLLGPLDARRKIADFQQEIGRTFYGGREFTLIPREGDDVLHAKIGNEAERPVYELGDGIQHMLIMMLPLFIHRDKNLLLFVEEPELYLHPGFQRILIDKFLDDDDVSRQVFVTTHSHQFLDITIDRDRCSVYRVSKNLEEGDAEAKARFKVQLASSDDFSILAELGVRNSSVMLSNCTIWVEGITDRLYFRKFLDIFQRSNGLRAYMEDLHYSFVEYGGGCIEHWSFLDRDDKEPGIEVKRLCGNLFLISDKDQGKGKRHQQLEKVLKDRFCLLDCVEVENLLTPATIAIIVEHYEGNITLKAFEQKDYKSVSLGTFIEDNILPTGHKSKRKCKEGSKPYAGKSGTVKDKTDFCHMALEHIKTINDLSPEATSVCKRIYEFIAVHNP